MKGLISFALLLAITLLAPNASSAQRLGGISRPVGPIVVTPPIVLTPNTVGGLSLESTLPNIQPMKTDRVILYQDDNRDLKAVVIPPASAGGGSGDGGGPDCEDKCKALCSSNTSCVTECMRLRNCPQ